MLLAEGGLNVVMLEAGPMLDPRKDFKEHVWPYELEHRGVGRGGNAPQNHLQQLSIQPNGIEHLLVPCEALRSLTGLGGGTPQTNGLV